MGGSSSKQNNAPPNNALHYPRLDLRKRQIRLLKIIGRDTGGHLQLSLECWDLEQADFIALSYTWGRYEESKSSSIKVVRAVKEKPQYIDVDGQSFLITPSLLEFLQFASWRKLNGRLFFADQICINQSDQTEKEHQVSLMGDVYSYASEVLVWLVPLRPEDPLLWIALAKLAVDDDSLKFLKRPHSTPWLKRIALRRYVNSIVDDLTLALFSAYWSRQWTVQEILLAKELSFQIGQFTFDWDILRNLARYCKAYKTASSNPIQANVRIFPISQNDGPADRISRARLGEEPSPNHLLLLAFSTLQLKQDHTDASGKYQKQTITCL